MHGDPVLGELSDGDIQEAREAAEAAGHAWDLRAAVLASADPGAGELPSTVIRGGPARPGEKAFRESGELLGSIAELESAEWQQTLESLIAGHLGELLFVEFTPDYVKVIKACLDDRGIPRQADAGSAEWHLVAPMLDHRTEIRKFQLAGGIGTLQPISRTEFDAAVLRWLKAYIPPSCTGSMVLVTRRTGWVLLDRAAAALREMFAVRAEIGPGAALPATTETTAAVQEVLRTAPLRFDHTLLLARVDRRTGAVHADSRVLFPAGLRLARGETATATVTVHGGVADTPSAALPVLCGIPAAGGGGAEPLGLMWTHLRALQPTPLTFVLHGPGEVEMVTTEGGSPGERPAVDLAGLIRDLPRRILRPPRLELHLTVELSGADEAETAERLMFVRELITSLAGHGGAGQGPRIAVVGHYDHVIHENRYTRRPTLLLRVPAGPAEAALAALSSWRPARREQDTASSLEDALKEVAPLRAAESGRDSAVRRIVLVVGRRPPGVPTQQYGLVPTCPLGADWRAELDRLRGAGLRVMTRADPVTGPRTTDRAGLPAQEYAAGAWAALSADGFFRPGADAPADVARALTPPWQTDGPPCRLAFAAPLL
ncbi:hypothetical protein OG729_34320 [Streptomyces sp. NBC_00210]|uniref:hypothetical protein n=1 Tax=Streptomyces sp. NBC_00210 TaxID=2903636 RepID=UPI00324D0E03